MNDLMQQQLTSPTRYTDNYRHAVTGQTGHLGPEPRHSGPSRHCGHGATGTKPQDSIGSFLAAGARCLRLRRRDHRVFAAARSQLSGDVRPRLEWGRGEGARRDTSGALEGFGAGAGCSGLEHARHKRAP